MKQGNDVSGLQLLLNGVVAIALVLHLVGVFVMRLHEQHKEHKALNKDTRP